MLYVYLFQKLQVFKKNQDEKCNKLCVKKFQGRFLLLGTCWQVGFSWSFDFPHVVELIENEAVNIKKAHKVINMLNAIISFFICIALVFE